MEKGTVEIPDVSDLLEVDSMLAERIESWTREWSKRARRRVVFG
jgi:hypothetical protein